jgi:hypothetical protein
MGGQHDVSNPYDAEKKQRPCQCCGKVEWLHPVGIPDGNNHVWSHDLCEECEEWCNNDIDDQGRARLVCCRPGTTKKEMT